MTLLLFWRRTLFTGLAACLTALMALPSSADLVHRYTFNDADVDDSQGSDHGDLISPDGSAFYYGGQLYLTNNNGATSGQDFTQPGATGGFAELPAGIVSGAASAGVSNQISLEFWVTVEENRAWARLGDFGISDQGAGQSGDANEQDYLAVFAQTDNRTPSNTIPAELPGGEYFGVTTHSLLGDEFPEAIVADPVGPLPTGTQQHIVVTVDETDTTGGAEGTIRIFRNGTQQGVGPVVTDPVFSVSIIFDQNNWLGRSQFGGDSLFDGSYDEFSIYSHALSSGEVSTNFASGPVAGEIGAPVLVVDRETGNVRLENQTGETAQIVSYSIESEAGGLDASGWVSINDDNSFDPGGSWSGPAPTVEEISESTGGSGGTLGVGSDAPIGMAWNPSPLEDIRFSYTLNGRDEMLGIVQYVGFDGAIDPADLDADGDIDVDDWTLFAASSHTTIGSSAYDRYKGGDLNGDGENNYADFRLFKEAYSTINGPEAFAALFSGQAAPEPTAALLMATLLGFAASSRRSRC